MGLLSTGGVLAPATDPRHLGVRRRQSVRASISGSNQHTAEATKSTGLLAEACPLPEARTARDIIIR